MEKNRCKGTKERINGFVVNLQQLTSTPVGVSIKSTTIEMKSQRNYTSNILKSNQVMILGPTVHDI